MSQAIPQDIKSPSAILAEDVICQSFIQSSSTLAYACLLIRRGRHELATHVLHFLEAKPASRFKDMVLYMQAQIGIETGDFAEVKRRLAMRAHRHQNDMVALSLLEACVFLEWEGWQRSHPAGSAMEAAGSGPSPAMAAIPGPRIEASESPAESPSEPGSSHYRTVPVPTVSSLANSGSASGTISGSSRYEGSRATPAGAAGSPAGAAGSASGVAGAPGAQFSLPSGSREGDFGLYQPLSDDPNSLALSLWNVSLRRFRMTCKKAELEPLMNALPPLLPSGLDEAVKALEGGEIHKVCFSFQGLTLTTFHAGPECLGLVTGNINQSLLTMVRAENVFLKGSYGSGRGRPSTDRRESASLELTSDD